MGKKKNKNKLSGAEKTAAKTEKKLASKLKNQLACLGEEDILKVIAEIEREEAKRSAASEKNLPGPPSARAYASLTPHPTNNELIMFGGEYHDGQKTEVYNDLLFFNPEKGTWRQVKAPGGPPPRSAHQAIATPANKGELWIFGGEFTSPTESQFHHYKDLWCFSLSDKKWEKVVAPNGPSSRSGHRMVQLGRKLVIFGGYNDNGRESKYFDDVYMFCLDTRAWSKLAPSGKGPSARSACVMIPAGNDSLLIYGGFSRVREGRTERTHTHTDMFRLSLTRAAPAAAPAGAPVSAPASAPAAAWRSLPGRQQAPPARSGQASAFNPHSGRGYVFGGIMDVEETDEEIRGEMSDELHSLDLKTGQWYAVTLNCKSASAQTQPEMGHASDDNVTTDAGARRRGAGGPAARMSAAACVQRAALYLYGGVLEKDHRQFHLSDFYSLDLHKLNGWKTIHEQPSLPAWVESDSEGWQSGSGSDSDSDSDDSA